MPTAHDICICAVFATSSFNFGLSIYFVSQYCYGRASYTLCYRRVFFLRKVEQSSITGVANGMSKVTHNVGVHFNFVWLCSLSDILALLDSNNIDSRT